MKKAIRSASLLRCHLDRAVFLSWRNVPTRLQGSRLAIQAALRLHSPLPRSRARGGSLRPLGRGELALLSRAARRGPMPLREPLPVGLLVLGQREALSLDARHGSELLMFLGCSLAAIIRRWLIQAPD